jgi:hypothetical protein
MAPERIASPEISQALEEAGDTLRAERRTLGPLAGENAALRERLERLEAERDQLQEELKGLRKGRSSNHARLPEVLVPPFRIRPPVPMRRQLRTILPSMALLGLLFFILRDQAHAAQRVFVFCIGVFLLMRSFGLWLGGAWWDFSKTGIRGGGKEAGDGLVPYSRITGIKVDTTPSQRRRGVGTVQVAYEEKPGGEMKMTLTLKDVPEPERLASWIQEKRSQRLGDAG